MEAAAVVEEMAAGADEAMAEDAAVTAKEAEVAVPTGPVANELLLPPWARHLAR